MDRELRHLRIIGLRSDTALSGVDVCLITTDGVDIFERKKSVSRPFPAPLKEEIEEIISNDLVDLSLTKQTHQKLTLHYISAIQELLDSMDIGPRQVDLIAFSGHTIAHHPEQKLSIQLGDPKIILKTFNIPVVSRFYQSDLQNGGKGSPIFASFYDAITRELEKPVIVLTIGGLSSLTYIGPNGELIAFDVGPGNILIDQWMMAKLGAEMDFDGLWATKGTPNEKILDILMADSFFSQTPPKSMDRDAFRHLLPQLDGLSIADGAATLTKLTGKAIQMAIRNYLPNLPVQKIIVNGGGSFNPAIMRYLKQNLNAPVVSGQEIGWSNAIEAEGFAFLGARCVFGLPISFPTTTGVKEPMTGGRLYESGL